MATALVLAAAQTPLDMMREYLNAIWYVLHSGCSWRMLPHGFPPWSTVYEGFRKPERTGTRQQLNDALCTQVRLSSGREAQPSL